jgi:hypothetical protein
MTDFMGSKVLAAAHAQLNDPIVHMLKTGFFIEPDWVRGETLLTAFKIRPVARKVAKEMKRPFIFVSGRSVCSGSGKWEKVGYRLQFPKRAYLEPVVAPLLLCAKEITHRYNAVYDSTVSRDPNATTFWDFMINDLEFYRQYTETVQSDPDMRKALRLDT